MNSVNLSFPWGTEDLFVHNKTVTVKFLNVKSGEAPSLQYHRHRDEFWKILSGTPEVVIGDQTIRAVPGQEFNVPALTKHRIIATEDDAVVLEISFGDFDEKDIVRLEDKYGRV
jgi:mannose-6-phosphate isomerase-like protein (cupin superfamily)